MRYWLAFVLTLLATPAVAASFDCRKASTLTEKIICADPELSALDSEVAQAYATTLKTAWGGAIASYVRDDQRAWIGERRVYPAGGPDSEGCEAAKARACLRDMHRYRLAVLHNPGYRLSGVYERGDHFLRIIAWDDGLELAFNAGDISGYPPGEQHVRVGPGATTVVFPIEDDLTCDLTVSFTVDAATVKQDGQCAGANLNGRWTRNLSRQPAGELF